MLVISATEDSTCRGLLNGWLCAQITKLKDRKLRANVNTAPTGVSANYYSRHGSLGVRKARSW